MIYKNKQYQVIVKEWFDRTYGNSYFSARIYDQGDLIDVLPFQYGYGDHALDMARKALSKRFENSEQVKQILYSKLFNLIDKQEGCLKREVTEWGKE